MRSVAAMALALVAELACASLALGQKILKENPYYLRSDSRLQVSLHLEAEHPKLAHILARLHDATGLDIAVAENLQDHDPDFGYVQPSKQGYYAWQIMEMVAKQDLPNGYWEKTERGYRLVAPSLVANLPTPPEEGTSRLFG
jgi:hypothetical protein